MRPERLAGILLAVAAFASLAGAVFFWSSRSSVGYYGALILGAIAGTALMVAMGFGLVAFLAVRGGAAGSAAAMLVSGLVLLRAGPYFVMSLLRGDSLSWLAVVGILVALFAAVFIAGAWGLTRHLRAQRT